MAGAGYRWGKNTSDPTPEEIADRMQMIKAGWSRRVRLSRKVDQRVDSRDDGWTPPEVSNSFLDAFSDKPITEDGW